MTITKRVAGHAGVAALALVMLGCADNGAEDVEARTLTVQIHSTEDLSQSIGSVTFMEDSPSGLVAMFDIKANDVLPPGLRAIHIHQNPNCDPAPTSEGGEPVPGGGAGGDRKSTRLNSSHVASSYAVFCLKKKMCLLRT